MEKTSLLPHYVEVIRTGINAYSVSACLGGDHYLLFAGNAEQVHSWLAQHDYKAERHEQRFLVKEYYRCA